MGRWINVHSTSSAWIRIDQSVTCLQPFFWLSDPSIFSWSSHNLLMILSWFPLPLLPSSPQNFVPLPFAFLYLLPPPIPPCFLTSASSSASLSRPLLFRFLDPLTDALIMLSWSSHNSLIMFHTFASSSTLFFFSFLFPLALPPFPPRAPPLPLLLALTLCSHPPYSGRSHKLLINFSRIHINTKRSTSIEFRKNCPVRIYIYIYIYIVIYFSSSWLQGALCCQ